MQHNKLNLPDGDVLIHCGDFTNHGSLQEVREFAAWLTTLSFKYIIIVPGNHGMVCIVLHNYRRQNHSLSIMLPFSRYDP
jgi:predicted phosphodiesterase